MHNSPEHWQHLLPTLAPDGHKYHRGAAAIVGGDIATGAARLAARAALRSGAGVVSVVCSEQSFPIYAGALEAVMVKPQRSNLAPLVADARYTGWLVGSGLGHGAQARDDVLSALYSKHAAIVIDADGLTSFEKEPELLFSRLHERCILTPHSGEFERLFGEFFDKLSATQQASSQSGAVVVHKGALTIIAAPDGRYATCDNAPPSLATAGSGDVLAGIITGLCAQGMSPFEASCAGVWIHGEAAKLYGAGLIAEDLPDLVPKAFLSVIPAKAGIQSETIL